MHSLRIVFAHFFSRGLVEEVGWVKWYLLRSSNPWIVGLIDMLDLCGVRSPLRRFKIVVEGFRSDDGK